MLRTQIAYCDYLDSIYAEINKLDMNPDVVEAFNFNNLKKDISGTELIIPVVGAFSAGKSSLLNSFLSSNYLSVNIRPETAIATELRYSPEERIEAVMPDGGISKYAITEMADAVSNAGKFKFIRVYLNNENLKEMQPLILVDMPGLDSTFDAHNRAIIEYIDRGVHYIVLTSVEEGTLTRSIIRQLVDIKNFGRDFSFFLSKTNLRSSKEVEEVKHAISEQITDYLDLSKEITSVDDNGGENLKRVLAKINPDELVDNLFNTVLKEHFFKISDSLQTSISSFSKTKTENEENLKILEESLNKLIEEKNRMIEETKDRYADVNVNLMIENIGRSLSESIDELTNAALHGNKDALSALINDIVSHSVITEIREIGENFSDVVIQQFSANLKKMDLPASGLDIPDVWINKIAESAKRLVNSTVSSIQGMNENRKNKPDVGTIYKTTTTIISILTNTMNPILEVLIVFLPDLLNGLFSSYAQKKQKDALQSKILTEIVPNIKSNIRRMIPSIMKEQLIGLVESVGSSFEDAINVKKDAVIHAQKELSEKNADIQEKITSYKTALNNINKSAESLLFSGK